jgi:glycerophosphoryl diester phosphodiesterase
MPPAKAFKHLALYSLLALAMTSRAASSPVDSTISKSNDAPVNRTPRGHSHNDYKQPVPLKIAYENDCESIEADVFYFGDDLLVAHHANGTRSNRTLESLYLDPLMKMFKEGKLKNPIQLLVDIKTDGQETYEALHIMLSRYQAMLKTYYKDGHIKDGPVSVRVSGHHPSKEFMMNQTVRYADYDGRWNDIEETTDTALVKEISINFKHHFKNSHFTEHYFVKHHGFNARDCEKLRNIVGMVHANGREIRFWNTPDNVEMYEELANAGVDFVNTDNPVKYNAFCQKREQRQAARALMGAPEFTLALMY